MKAIVNINGEIGVDATLMSVVAQMKQFKNATELEININSIGGFVNAGNEIYNYLESFNIPTTTIASGICASIATKLMLLGQERKVIDGTKFMIHNPFLNGVKGDADQLAEYSEKLRDIENNLLGFYSEKLEQSKLAIQPLMKRETFLTNDEMLTLGFATEIVEGEVEEVQLKAVAKLESINVEPKINEMSVKIDEKSQKSLLEKIQSMIENRFNPKAVLEIADSEGNVLVFPELEPEQTPEVGSVVSAEDGSYTIGDTIMVVEAGAITAINEVEESYDEEKEKMQADLKAKEEELEQMKAQLEEVQNKLKEKEEIQAKAVAELEEIKNTVSSWELDKKPQPQGAHLGDLKPEPKVRFKLKNK